MSDKKAATAKAKLLRDALRCASSEGCSAQAQAVLALLIAESWPEQLRNKTIGWVARLGYPMIARRLNTSQASARRWCNELIELNLVMKHSGSGQRITRWLIARKVLTHEHTGCAPVSRGVLTGEHPSCAPVSTVFRSIPQTLNNNRTADDGPPAKAATVPDGAGQEQDLGLPMKLEPST